MTFRNIKCYREFNDRVEILWFDHYADRELEAMPSTVLGGFWNYRRTELIELTRLHPEYHIVTCLAANVLVNGFVEGGVSYYLAEGDRDPNLIHDPEERLDAHALYSLRQDTNARL